MATAIRSTAKPYLRIEQLRREAVESYIDQLIGLLDDIDGDENLEPYLADTYPASEDREGAEDDPNGLETREGDTSDYEPSCGWTPTEASEGRYVYAGDEEQELNGDETYHNRCEDDFGNGFGGFEPTRERRLFDLLPNELPDTYVMTGEGTCMEPEIMDGTKLMFSRKEPYQKGDIVLLFQRPELTKPGEHQLLIKRLIYAPPAGYWTDPLTFRGGDIVPVVLVEMDNPRKVLQFAADELLGIHKCLGPLPMGKPTYRISDREVREQHGRRIAAE